jgi:hypothetical protein
VTTFERIVVGHNGVVDLEELVNRFEGMLVASAGRISRRLGWEGEADW